MELKTASDYSKKVKSAIKYTLQVEVKAFQSSVPFLNMPIVSTIFEYYVGKFIEFASEGTRLQLFYKFIDMRVIDQKGDFISSIDKLDEARSKGDFNEVKRLFIEFMQSQDNLIKFNRI